jgi:4'-phosphopantetheinyl transferase EntD
MAQVADFERQLTEPIRAWLGSQCLVLAAAVDPANEGLLQPEERRCIATAVASRRAEFATGRVLARRALSQLGHPSDALLMLKDRAPDWPTTCEASISHAGGICLVAARPRSGHGIGVDLEVLTRLDEPSRSLVLTDHEQASFAAIDGGWGANGAHLAALQAFSIKESLFKAMRGVGNHRLDFQAIELFPQPNGTWAAHPREDFQRRLPEGVHISVWSAQVAGFVVSAAALS